MSLKTAKCIQLQVQIVSSNHKNDQKITVFLIVIYSFIKLDVLFSLPKGFRGPLIIGILCNLSQLISVKIQPVFSEVKLVTFCQRTLSCGVGVVDYYLNNGVSLKIYRSLNTGDLSTYKFTLTA